jgi:hypothetical protein
MAATGAYCLTVLLLAAHDWLNDVIAIGEGSIDPDSRCAGHALLRLRGGLPTDHRDANRSVTGKGSSRAMSSHAVATRP